VPKTLKTVSDIVLQAWKNMAYLKIVKKSDLKKKFVQADNKRGRP